MDKTMKLIVNDIEVEVKMSEEDYAKLSKAKDSKITGYERTSDFQAYFIIEGNGEIECVNEFGDAYDEDYYKAANYYTDQTVAENNARADKLMRQLRRFAAENCQEVGWSDHEWHYCIYYNYDVNTLDYSHMNTARDFGQIYFDTSTNAQKAIDMFKDELIWYFTEYRDRV